VLRADLDFEGLFKFVPETLMTALPAASPDSPNFVDWKGVGAQILVVTRAQVSGTEGVVELRAFAVDSGQSILSKRYTGPITNPRVFAHQSSDDIVALSGYRGVARTKISFSSDRDSTKERRVKELYVVDYDGYGPKRVTVNGTPNILASWSPDGRKLAYVSYRQDRNPDIYVASIYEGRSDNLTKGQGQSFAPSWSPDGSKIAYASNRRGSMDIWVANADGSGSRRLSQTTASDTAPFWSPTGQEIVFTSSRTGAPQIYVMDSEGLNVRRLSRVGNYNDAPAWNPSKQFPEIAYTSRLEGNFEIAVMSVDGSGVRQVSEGRGSCEYPSWAPSGRHLVFACQRGGTWQLVVTDRLGAKARTLNVGPGNNVYPDWGP
jgi:TolB protein